MKTVRTVQIIALITFFAAAGAISAWNQPDPVSQPLAIDPSIPSITITAKRLTAAEKIQWEKDDADQAARAMAAKETAPMPSGVSLQAASASNRG